MRRLTLKQLMTIRAVAQAGTIAMAAETLNVTAAALTSRIKHLEEDAQTLLFDRIGGRLRLTDAGQEVVNAATRINLAQSCNGIGWIFGPIAGGMFFYGKDAAGVSTGVGAGLHHAGVTGMALAARRSWLYRRPLRSSFSMA